MKHLPLLPFSFVRRDSVFFSVFLYSQIFLECIFIVYSFNYYYYLHCTVF